MTKVLVVWKIYKVKLNNLLEKLQINTIWRIWVRNRNMTGGEEWLLGTSMLRYIKSTSHLDSMKCDDSKFGYDEVRSFSSLRPRHDRTTFTGCRNSFLDILKFYTQLTVSTPSELRKLQKWLGLRMMIVYNYHLIVRSSRQRPQQLQYILESEGEESGW